MGRSDGRAGKSPPSTSNISRKTLHLITLRPLRTKGRLPDRRVHVAGAARCTGVIPSLWSLQCTEITRNFQRSSSPKPEDNREETGSVMVWVNLRTIDSSPVNAAPLSQKRASTTTLLKSAVPVIDHPPGRRLEQGLFPFMPFRRTGAHGLSWSRNPLKLHSPARQ